MTKVSVILPVYNGAPFLKQAISSILSQTYTDFELVVIDDGSNDESVEIVKAIADHRVRLIANEINLGLPATLNKGIANSTGKYIARQDQDDFAAPNRLARQVGLMDANSDIGLLGTWAKILDEGVDGEWIASGEHKHPVDDATLRWRLLWNSPFVHSSVMMRRNIFDAVGGYATEPERLFPEDYDLWSRIAKISSVANIPDFLQFYRQTPNGLSRIKNELIREGVYRVGEKNLGMSLQSSFRESDVRNIVRSLNGQNDVARSTSEQIRWTKALWNASSGIQSPKRGSYRLDVVKTWVRLMRNSLRKSG